MTLIPKNQNAPFPPQGGYSFTDARTGMRFDGLHSNAQGTALKVIAHRNANPNLYPEGGGDPASVLQEIYAQKFATHPHLFVGQEPAPQPQPTKKTQVVTVHPQAAAGRPCSCGANDWSAVYCKACGPGKISGYVCKKCGRRR